VRRDRSRGRDSPAGDVARPGVNLNDYIIEAMQVGIIETVDEDDRHDSLCGFEVMLMGDLELRYEHLRKHRDTPARRERCQRLKAHIDQIWAEQEQRNQ
jgi:hypothetical protein